MCGVDAEPTQISLVVVASLFPQLTWGKGCIQARHVVVHDAQVWECKRVLEVLQALNGALRRGGGACGVIASTRPAWQVVLQISARASQAMSDGAMLSAALQMSLLEAATAGGIVASALTGVLRPGMVRCLLRGTYDSFGRTGR